MSNQSYDNEDKNMNKRIENLFSGEEPPSYMSISQVESLKQRITELENKLSAAEKPEDVEPASVPEKEPQESAIPMNMPEPSSRFESGFHRINSLSAKILLPALSIFAIALAAFFFYNFYIAQVDNNAREVQDSKQAEEFFNSELENMENFALGLAIQSATNPEIQAAFADRDREALTDLTLNTYKALDSQFDIPQYQFHLSSAVSFLRLHNPESYGDDLSTFRFTVLEVNKALKPVAGLEVGRGGMGMRGIVPMFYKGRHTGSVEFGLNIDDTFLKRMKQEFGGDWRIILTKDALSLATLEDISKLEEGPASDLLVLASTLDGAYAPADSYTSALNGEQTISRVRDNGKTYSVTTLPLRDYTGKVIGTIDIVIDRTEIVAQQAWRIGFMLIAMAVALAAGSYSLRRTTKNALKPLDDLTRASEAVERGDLTKQVAITSQDEIGQLGYTFNRMTGQLQTLISSLEQRVAERTHDLELSAVVGRTITEEVKDMDGMLSKAVDIIRTRFNLYYTQIYLVNALNHTIVLRAGTGEVGKQLLARGHQLKIGPNSINGRAVAEKRAIIVADTEKSPFFLKNELLPDTRSEMAVPLIVGNRVVGVLDMQSEQPNTLNENNLTAFEALSGQLAVAIQNADLFEEATTARLDLEERATRQTYENWHGFLNAIDRGEKIGFAFQQNKLIPITEGTMDEQAISAPIQIIGAQVGQIQVAADEKRTWSDTDLQVIQATADQLSRHLDNLRLLEQAETYRVEAEQAVKRLTREGWDAYLNVSTALQSGFIYDRNKVKPVEGNNGHNENQRQTYPIQVRDEVIGEVATYLEHASEETSELILSVAEQLGTHIENLRLTEQAQTALLTTEKLYDASRTLNAAETEIEALNGLVNRLDRSGLDRIVAAIKVSNDPLTAEVVSAWDRDGLEAQSIGNRFTDKQLPLVAEIVPGIPAIFENFDAPGINPLTQKVFKMQNVRSAAVIPIASKDEIIGWLLLETTHATRQFDPSSIQQYLTFADQVAIVIQRQRLFTRTETQRLEIQQNETRLSEALEIARLANWEYDVEKDLFMFNDQFYSIFHTTAEEAGGYQLSSAQYAEKFVHPDDMPVVGMEIGKALNSTERFYTATLEHRIIYADGGIGYIAVNLNVERDENGKITRYFGANQDITERKLAEELIRMNEARLAEALEIARLGNWEYNFEKDLFTFNDNFYSIFRTNVKEVGSYQISSAEYARRFVHPDDAALVGEEIGKAISTTERHFNQKLEHRIIFPDGSIGYISVNIHVERDENGKIIRWYGANQDITERKTAELELERLFADVEQSQALLRSIIDATPDWIFVKDREHRYQLVNQGYANALHIPPEEFVGKNDLDLGFPEELVKGAPEKGIRGFWADDQLVLETNETQVFPDDPATIDGKIHTFHTIKTPLKDADGKPQSVLAFARDITDRKLAEELIRTNEARLSEALDIARLANWEYDFEKDLFTFNDHFYSIFRTNVQEVGSYQIPSSEYARRFVHPDDAAMVGQEIGKAMTTTERYFNQKVEHRIIFPDGSIGYISVNVHVERDENGKIVRWYGVNQDITDRRLAEAETSRLAQAVQSTADMVVITDRNGNIQFANNAFEKLTGYKIEEALGGNPRLIKSGQQDKDFYKHLWGEILAGRVWSGEITNRRKDGSLYEAQLTISPIFDNRGEITQFVAVQRDVTQMKRDQNIIAVRANQLETVATVSTTASTVLNPDALLQTVVDLTKERFNLYHAHIYLADEDWNTLLLSAGASEVGRKMAGAGHAIQMDAQRSLVARAARERQAIIVNDIHTDVGFLPNPLLPDTHAEMAVPMIVGDKVLGVFDVQSEKIGFFTEEDALIYSTLASQVAVALQNARLYQSQAATLTQLRELDRLKSSFLANMSHELRTPLNSILGFTDVMLEGLDGSLTPYMQNDLSLIQKNGQHLLHLINDVLDMAKIESGKLNLVIEKFHLQEVVEEVMSITSPLANEKKLELEIDPKSEIEIEVNADRTRLRQVLLNLVNNAAKFTESGKITVRALREANNVLISVKDTGIGIPPTHLESVFQEFTQVDSSTTRKAGGTGLGLPISRRLIQMHGGRLWAESTGIEGEGSTFYVFLPLEAKVAEPEITSKR